MVGTADHMSDPHIDVVSDHAQVVGGTAIGAQQHEVFQFCVGEFNPPGDGVVKKCAAGFGHSEPQSSSFASGPASRAFFARNRTADAFVSWRTSCGSGGCAPLLQFFPGAEAIVGVSRGQEFRCILAIQFDALSLIVGTLVPVEAEPTHALRGFLRPSPQWSAPDRCLQCEG